MSNKQEPTSKKAKKEEEKRPEPPREDNDDDDDDSSDDDSLVLEGVLMRNPDISDSDDSSEDDSEEEKEEAKPSAEDKKGEASKKKKKRKRKKPAKSGPDITEVEFVFWDMREKFFHGMKTLLHSSSTVYAAHSSSFSDLMIENVSVGTIISTEGDEEGNVFGFASVLNVSTYQDQNCIKYLKKMCLDKCPTDRKAEMQTVLSGKTKRPAGFLLHARMVNLPLEIVEVLHQQLVKDMDWAVENAEGGEEERKSLDFGAFVRIAPASQGDHGSVEYKYFDDEIFATNAEFVYQIDAPKTFGAEVKHLCCVIVMTKTGHRAAMKELRKLIGG